MSPSVVHRGFAFVGATVFVAGVVAGFWQIGSPTEARVRRMDEARRMNLHAIHTELRHRLENDGALPDALADLPLSKETRTDPVSGEPYAYRVLGPARFELCATFEREGPGVHGDAPPRAPYPGGPPDYANHPVGRTCFTSDVTPPDRD